MEAIWKAVPANAAVVTYNRETGMTILKVDQTVRLPEDKSPATSVPPSNHGDDKGPPEAGLAKKAS